MSTLVARSPHIEHVPFILPVPGPVVVVVIGDVDLPPDDPPFDIFFNFENFDDFEFLTIFDKCWFATC